MSRLIRKLRVGEAIVLQAAGSHDTTIVTLKETNPVSATIQIDAPESVRIHNTGAFNSGTISASRESDS